MLEIMFLVQNLHSSYERLRKRWHMLVMPRAGDLIFSFQFYLPSTVFFIACMGDDTLNCKTMFSMARPDCRRGE